jgi:hypothetical protein
MKSLLEDIWASEGMADTCIMLSTLLQTTVSLGITNRVKINDQYRKLVPELAQQGHCIYLADMDPPDGQYGHGWISIANDMISDGIHPNDEGHRKMADVLYKTINKAAADGKIVAASDFDAGASTGYDKVFGSGRSAGSLTQLGSDIDDKIYYHNSESMGVVLTVESTWHRDQWRFARLFSREEMISLVGSRRVTMFTPLAYGRTRVMGSLRRSPI